MNQHNDDSLDTTILGSLLEAVPPESPPSSLRQRILSRVQKSEPDRFTTVHFNQRQWKTLIPGVEYSMLVYDVAAGSKSFLLRAQAGARLPEHTHHSYEECLVLDGEFCLGDLTLHAGDFHGAASSSTHGETWTRTGVTVYLRSSTLDYPGIVP